MDGSMVALAKLVIVFGGIFAFIYFQMQSVKTRPPEDERERAESE